jgi:hypothetical protein
MQAVLETASFASAAKASGLIDEDRLEIATLVARDPRVGEIIKGTGGARKFRFGMRGKGKRGGARVITFFAAPDVPVFLLDVYTKGERVDLSQDERNQLRAILGGIADDYRASVKSSVTSLRGKLR